MNRSWKTAFCAALFFAVGLFAVEPGVAQATYTATLAEPPIAVFAGGSYIQPQPEYYKNNQMAYLFGADYTKYLHRYYVDPSIEVRALLSPLDEEVGENVYSGGLKLSHTYLHRIRPYGDFLVGAGTIKYDPVKYNNERSDNSIVLTYGGGVDFDVFHNIGLKADYQGSRWHTGTNVYFHPKSLNFAVYYRFGFSHRQ